MPLRHDNSFSESFLPAISRTSQFAIIYLLAASQPPAVGDTLGQVQRSVRSNFLGMRILGLQCRPGRPLLCVFHNDDKSVLFAETGLYETRCFRMHETGTAGLTTEMTVQVNDVIERMVTALWKLVYLGE